MVSRAVIRRAGGLVCVRISPQRFKDPNIVGIDRLLTTGVTPYGGGLNLQVMEFDGKGGGNCK